MVILVHPPGYPRILPIPGEQPGDFPERSYHVAKVTLTCPQKIAPDCINSESLELVVLDGSTQLEIEQAALYGMQRQSVERWVKIEGEPYCPMCWEYCVEFEGFEGDT